MKPPEIRFTIIGFPISEEKEHHFKEIVKDILNNCNFNVTILNSSHAVENNLAYINMPLVLQEIFEIIEVTVLSKSQGVPFDFVATIISAFHSSFPSEKIPWLVINEKNSFVSLKENVYYHKLGQFTVFFGTMVSSSQFSVHGKMEGDVNFFHDTKFLKIRYSTDDKKKLLVAYANFQYVLVNGLDLVILYSTPPVTRNNQENECMWMNPIDPTVLGKSTGMRMQFKDPNVLKEVLSKLNQRSIPIVFVQYSISQYDIPDDVCGGLQSDISFNCMYLIEAMVRQNFLLECQGIEDFLCVANILHDDSSEILERVLSDLLMITELVYPLDLKLSLKIWFSYVKHNANGEMLSDFMPSHTARVRKAVLTPTRVILLAPTVIIENRIIRQFNSDFALRVSFRDDNMAIFGTRLTLQPHVAEETVHHRMQDGLEIAGRKYEFLAWSNSQLRDHSVWMYAKDSENNTAKDIRNWMGDFSKIKNVAKLMARMGQCFSKTSDALAIPMNPENIEIIEDVKRGFDPETNNPYCFSDGIGKISPKLLTQVCESLDIHKEPSALQIRYSGCKGMVVKNTEMKDISLVFRNSMNKFDSNSDRLEIVKISSAMKVMLNRSLIAILEHHGIPGTIFLQMQKTTLQSLTEMLLDNQQAASKLGYLNNLRKVDIPDALKSGIDICSEPFFRGMLLAQHHHDILRLKEKARLPIDPSEGRNMFGVLDEYKVLNYGEVFVQYTEDFAKKDYSKRTVILKGEVIITKNPCYLAGDVRVFKCVDKPELHDIVDCVVFPQLGDRPHPNEMSGSDLDGDEYTVIWKKELLFRRNYPAGHFPAPKGPTKERIQEYHMIDFLTDFIQSDRIGTLASWHLAMADSRGVNCVECVELARRCSIAVDYPKSGVAAELSPNLKCPEYPDFMQRGHERSYKSRKILGKLYRTCRDFHVIADTKFRYKDIKVDPYLEFDGWEEFRASAETSLSNYTQSLLRILDTYGVKHESEAMSAAYTSLHPRIQEGRSGRFEAKELIAVYIHALWKKYRNDFMSEFKNQKNLDQEEMLKKASAWYIVTYRNPNPNVLSFPWIVTHFLSLIKLRNLSRLKLSSNQSYLLSNLENELRTKHKLPELDDNTLKILSQCQTAISSETLQLSTKVLLHWARKTSILSSKLHHGGVVENKFFELIMHVASKKSENERTIQFILSFLKFCASLRFESKSNRNEILPFAMPRYDLLSKTAMLSYQKLAVTANLSALKIGSGSDNEVIDMEPFIVLSSTVGKSIYCFENSLHQKSQAEGVKITIRKENENQYVINARGPINSIRRLEKILHKGDDYLKS